MFICEMEGVDINPAQYCSLVAFPANYMKQHNPGIDLLNSTSVLVAESE